MLVSITIWWYQVSRLWAVGAFCLDGEKALLCQTKKLEKVLKTI